MSTADLHLEYQQSPSLGSPLNEPSSLNGSMSPIGDLSIDNLDDMELPSANPFDKQRTGRIVPVTNVEDFQVNLTDQDDDDEEIDEDKNKAVQAQRFSMFKESTKPQLVNRMYSRSNQSNASHVGSKIGSVPNSPKSDDEDYDIDTYASPNMSNSNSNPRSKNAFSMNNMKNQPPPLQQEPSSHSIQISNGGYHMEITDANGTPTPAFGANSKSRSPEKPMNIDTATLTNSTSSNKLSKLANVSNSIPISQPSASIPYMKSNGNSQNNSFSRNTSPGFTLSGLEPMQTTKSRGPGGYLGSIPEKSDNLSTARLANVSSTSLRKDTSAFDVVNLEDINTNSTAYPQKSYTVPKMRIEHTNIATETSNMPPSDDDSDHENGKQQRVGRNISSHALPNTNNPPMGSSVSQEQIKQLTSMYMEQQRQHQQLIKDLNRVFVAGSPYGVDNAQTPSLSAALKEKGIMEPLHLTSQFQFTPPSQPYRYDVAFLVSQPILHSTGAALVPVAPLSCDDEEKSIQKAFGAAGRKINYIRKFATVNNLRQLITAGTQIIHYCGHGIRKALIFEADMVGQIGMSHMLRANHLRKLISAGGSADSKNNKVDTNLQLVFVSACHSEDAGKAFINAGAKHVVAVRRSAEMHDVAAGTFTYQFYFALTNGKTVKQAFQIASQSIEAQFVENNYLKNEAMKFVLLPKKANHDVVLFQKAGSDANIESNLDNFHDHTPKRGIKKFPQPPLTEWVGRFKSIHDLMHNILADKLIVISCDKGLGKTAMLTRTLHYLWDRSLLTGIFYFNIYTILKKNPSLSIAEIIAREMFPHLSEHTKSNSKSSRNRKQKPNTKASNVTNKQLIEELQKEDHNNQDKKFLIVFEDIDLFEYEHLAEDQRIDIFIEEVRQNCQNVKLLLTLGTPANRCSFLHDMDKRVMQLKPLNKEDSIKLLEIYLSKHFSMKKIRNKISVEKIASICKGYPALIKYAASRFQNDDDLENLNLRKQLREQVLNEYEKLRMTRYWKELSLDRGRLRIGELKQKIRQRDGQQLWEDMYGYRARGLLSTLLYKMREWYREHVGDQQFKMRPIWTYYELEFIQMELLPWLAKKTSQRFVAPKEVVSKLETAEMDLEDWTMDDFGQNKDKNNKKKKKWYQFKSSKNKDKDKTTKFAKHKSFNNLPVNEDDEKVSEEEKIPIEVFAEFFQYWKDLWKTMMEPKISPFYFKKDNEICLISGMMKKERALSIIAQYAKGTFLIRFSKQNAASLVLVVSTGTDQKPSQHKIHIHKDIDKGTVTFEYQTVRKGVHRSSSLYDLFNHLHFLEHLWYRRRGRDQDYIEKDKRKILKFFKTRQDVWKL